MSGADTQKNQGSAIAVIGIGCMFPDAANTAEYWKNTVEGKDAIRALPVGHWSPDEYFNSDPKKADHTYAKTGGFIKPYAFDPLHFGIAPHAIEATDTTQLLGMVCAHQALVDAGYGPDRDFDRERTSCVIGVTGTLELVIPLGARLGHPAWRKALKDAGVADDIAAQVIEDISDSYVPWQENSFPGLLGNVVAGRIANRLDLGGSNAVVDAACASSLAAVHMAVMELETGRTDMVITGGMDTFNDIFMYMCFSKTPALSPTGHSRPFDADGDGTILGEGLGAIILKRLSDAERDGDRIYAVLRGLGSSSDGRGQAIYAPAAKGQVKALTRAYDAAGIATDTIELIEAHGTGTKVGDGVEIDALAQIYGENEQKHCVIGSVKSQIGHTKAAAGAAGLIKCVMALHHKIQPPTLKVRQPHPKLAKAPFQVLDKARPWITRGDHPRRAAISAFGFGGSNFHGVLEEYRADDKPVSWDDETFLFTWSATSKAAIGKTLAETRAASREMDHASLHILARNSRRGFVSNHPHRLTLCAHGLEELQKRLDAAQGLLDQGGSATGVYYSEAPAQEDVALIFAGQGSQSPGMVRELMLSFPEAMESLEVGCRILRENEGPSPSLVDYIYPPQDFGADASANRRALTATRIAQLALGTIGAALLGILKRFGMKAAQFAGHSYGELLALYAAGVLSLEDMLRASYQRGLLMEKAGREGGGMLAVMASAGAVQAVLDESKLSLTIANHNAPEQVVVGGDLRDLETLKGLLKQKRMGAKSLEVSTAFHTDYVSEAVAVFDQWLSEHVTFQKPTVPVYSNMLASAYSEANIRSTLSGQLGVSVRFHEMLNRMREESGAVLVEVGPGRKLNGLLKASDRQALSLDSESRSSVLGLSALLAELSALGVKLDLSQWHPGIEVMPVAPKKTFTVMLTGANHRSERKPKDRKKAANPASQELPIKAVSVAPPTKAEAPRNAPAVPKNNPSAVVQPSAQSFSSNYSRAKIEDVMPPRTNQDLSPLETILKDMQDVQRRTTEAHTLFLENQRQFQNLLRDALLGAASSLEGTTQRSAADRSEGFAERVALPSIAAPTREERPAPRAAAVSSPRAPQAPSPAPRAPQPQPAPAGVAPRAVRPAAPEALSEKSLDLSPSILKIVSEATGFPVEMLAASMNLESDLGIDSIKKVEIFSQLQAINPQLQADASRMNEAQTIADLIAYATTDSHADEERKGAWSASPVAFAAAPKAGDARERILSVISEKTGFPIEMLSDDMDLESDLGIDSIKKVEIFSSLQEMFPLVPFQAAALHELHRVADIVVRIEGHSSQVEAVAAMAAGEALPDYQSVLWSVVAEKTGYPEEVLSLSMDLEADLGIDSIKRVEILSALTEKLPYLKDQATTEIRTLEDLLHLLQGVKVQIDDGLAESLLNPEAPEWDLSSKKKAPSSEPAIPEVTLSGSKVSCWKLKATPWNPGQNRFEPTTHGEVWVVDDGSNLARRIGLGLEEQGFKARLVSLANAELLVVSDRLQGLYILGPVQLDIPALTWLGQTHSLLARCVQTVQANGGFVVTISRLGGQFGLDGLSHLSQAYCGAASSLAKTLSQEWPTIHVRALDLGSDFSDGQEAARRCLEASFLQGPLEIGVQREQYVTLRLVEESFSAQDPEKILNPGDTVLVTGGARGVTAATLIALAKRYPVRFVIWGRTPLAAPEGAATRDLTEPAALKKQLLHTHPEWAHPKDLERAYRDLLSQRELQATFAALRRYGAEVVYEVVDVSQDVDVRVAFQSLKERYPVVQGLIHGAGVVRDKLLVDQSAVELAEVLATKLRILPYLETLIEGGTKWMVFFSSSTARLGRKGQGAYGLANEVLNRASAYFSTLGCRALALNWGPWDGGMVNDGLKKLFAGEGLGTIPLDTGAAIQGYLLEHPSLGSGEWLVLGEGGAKVLGDHILKQESILAQRTIRVANTPILLDHVIKSRAVVPAALMAEWIVEAASPLFGSLHLQEISKFQVWKGLVLDSDTEVTLEIVATHHAEDRIECVLRSRSTHGPLRPHAHAVLIFAKELPLADPSVVTFEEDPALATLQPYEEILFHGENLQYLEQVLSHSSDRLVARMQFQGEPSEWSDNLAHWHAQAPLLDAVFQGAIVWSSLGLNSRCLPSKFQSVQYFQPWKPQAAILDLRIVSAEGHRLIADAEIRTVDGELVLRVEGFEATLDASLVESFSMKALPSSADSNV